MGRASHRPAGGAGRPDIPHRCSAQTPRPIRPVYRDPARPDVSFVSLRVLDDRRARYPNPVSSYLYAIAQAPYWTGDNSAGPPDRPGRSWQTRRRTSPPLPARNTTLPCGPHNMALHSLTYEGGPGMSGTASLAAKIAANRHRCDGCAGAEIFAPGVRPRAIGLYMYYDDAGQYGQYGMWGLTENVLDTEPRRNSTRSPVVRRDIDRKALPPAICCPPPFAATSRRTSAPAACSPGAGYLYLGQGGACGFLVNVPASGSYALTLSVGTYYSATQASDPGGSGSRWVTWPSRATGGNLDRLDEHHAALTLSLTAGLHVISVSASGGAFGVQSVSAADAVKAKAFFLKERSKTLRSPVQSTAPRSLLTVALTTWLELVRGADARGERKSFLHFGVSKKKALAYFLIPPPAASTAAAARPLPTRSKTPIPGPVQASRIC